MKTWTVLLLASPIFVADASASLLCTSSTATTCTQVVAIPSATVAGNGFYSGSATFNLFGSIGAPAGYTLDTVTLEIVIRESVTALSLNNVGGTTMSSVTATDGAYFDADDTASTLDGSLLDAALPNSLNLHRSSRNIVSLSIGSIAAHSTFTCGGGVPCNLPQTLALDTGAIAGTTSSYTGTGQFELQYTVNTGMVLTGSNPINLRLNSETRTTDATATVVYTFTAGTPEPFSVALVGSGILVFVIGRKRRLGK